ncbi:MAG: hypothetical protein WC372_09130 [Candidatus Neomarinimicrobiota bacterium]|jgi:hypothetical protein
MAQTTFTLSVEEYEALVALAREGTKDVNGSPIHDKAVVLNDFLVSLEKKAGIPRDLLWVQWQELDEPLPPGTRFPERWPPEKRILLEYVTRRISRVDVDEVLNANAKNPTSVLVTRDPGALYGWTELDAFFR